MIFIVSVRRRRHRRPRLWYQPDEAADTWIQDSKDATNLDHHMHRFGYHFRQTIVEEARKALERDGVSPQATTLPQPGQPEAIPKSQHEINVQADAVLRDLFPRIPHTDRQEIITHAFQKVCRLLIIDPLDHR